MRSSARIEILGHLGKDAESRAAQSGAILVSFSMAHSPRVGQGQKEHTNWYRCTFVGKRAEAVAPYLLKGTAVRVRGDFDAREWQIRDGDTRTSLDVFVTELDLLGSKTDSQRPAFGDTAKASDFDDSEDVPF